MIKKGDVVALHGAWCDLMTVDHVDGDKVVFTAGDYADLSRVRIAKPDEVEVNQKIYD